MERFRLKRNRVGKYFAPKKVFVAKLVLIFVLVLILFIYATNKVEETLVMVCRAKVESIGIIISNSAIEEVMRDKHYEDLITFVKDDSGKIVALKSNVIEMNDIAAKIAIKVQEMYDELEDIYIYVPLRKFYRKQFVGRMWSGSKGKGYSYRNCNNRF